MENEVNWYLLGSGLTVVLVVMLIGIILAGNNNGVWLVALLPVAGILGGAMLIAGRESESQR